MAIIEPDILEGVLPELIALRHTVHSQPDLSGHEMATASPLLDYLSKRRIAVVLENCHSVERLKQIL